MTRFPSLFERHLASSLLLLSVACAGSTAPARFETASELSDAPRRAAGVAVDPATELPRATRSADSEQALVVLREPPDARAARETVKTFFRAIGHGSYQELEAVVKDEAWIQAGAMTGRQKARQFWQMRLSRLEYAAIGTSSVYRDNDLETYRAEDIPKLRPPRALGVSATGDDVVVRVPISNPRSGKTRLFGDEILFVLRPEAGRYSIVEMAEDFSMP